MVLGCLSLGIGQPLLAQLGSESLRTGQVVLTYGDTLKGQFSVSLGTDLVQFRQANMVKTFSARQVTYFDFQDPQLMLTRYFYSLPYAERGSYKVPKFFELIYRGPALSLYCRETVVIENVPYYDGFSNRTYYSTRTKLIWDYYFQKENGLVVHYKPGRKALLELMSDQEKAIKRYMDEAQAGTLRREHLVSITDYYNALKYPLPPGKSRSDSSLLKIQKITPTENDPYQAAPDTHLKR